MAEAIVEAILLAVMVSHFGALSINTDPDGMRRIMEVSSEVRSATVGVIDGYPWSATVPGAEPPSAGQRELPNVGFLDRLI